MNKSFRWRESIKGLGVGVLGLGILGILLLLAVLFTRGVVWAAEKLMPWLAWASAVALLVCVLLLPLCIFRRTRPWAGIGYFAASYAFGAMLWAYACLFVVSTWGYAALIIGLLFYGIGVVPIAILAAVFHGEWSALWQVLLSIALTFGTRGLGAWLMSKSKRTEQATFTDVPV
jgi:hypothetical protein